MHNRFTSRKALSLLLLFAMLIVSVAALVPVVGSADAAVIQDFSFQTISTADQNSAQTDVRFLFSINDLDYDKVGFVFSKTNEIPTAGGTGCATYETTNVYSAVTANSVQIDAPDGRWWVAVKLSGIPLASFENNIYVRPYVKKGEVYTYGDAASLTVLKALTLDKVVAGEGSIYNSKAPGGSYRYLDHFFITKTVGDIKGNTKSFHPTESNPDGNDLWFEYSFLWNDTLSNWDQSKSEMMLFGFRNEESSYRDFYYLYMRDNSKDFKTSGDCPYAGHIDYSTYMGGWSNEEAHLCAADLTSEGNYYLFGDRVGRYNAGWDYYHGGVKHSSSPYLYDSTMPTKGGAGWHRLGFHFHQGATVDNDKGGVVYTGYTELFINGVKVWRVETDMQGYWDGSQWKQLDGYNGVGKADLKSKGLLLWEAMKALDVGDNAEEWTLYDGLYYKDQDTLKVQARLDKVALSTTAVYVGVADICWTCGDGFAHPVSAVNIPAARTLILNDQGNDNPADDVTTSSAIWYVYDN